MQIFIEYFSLAADICVLIITVYTLYITVFSKKISMLNPGESMSMFYGQIQRLYLKNHSLHSIPVTKVFWMKRIDGKFYRISVAEYEEPLIVDAWHIVKVESKPFTEIIGLDSLVEIYQDAVVGIESGENMLWVKPYKRAPLHAAKRAYKKLDYEVMTVSRREYNGKVISTAVKYIIYLRVLNLQGQSEIKTVFVHASGIFSETLGAFNGVDGKYCTSPQKLEKHLKKELQIKGKDICVKEIKQGLTS